MSYSEGEKYNEIGRIIHQYLVENNLPKIAFLTNCLPSWNDKNYLLQYFNYICFCASSIFQASQFLLSRYFLRYRKTPFDVVIKTPYSCMLSRRYGYSCLELSNGKAVNDLIYAISENKSIISGNFPIIMRIKCLHEKFDINLPSNCILEKRFDEADIMLQVK